MNVSRYQTDNFVLLNVPRRSFDVIAGKLNALAERFV
jgi:hypothetical protein